MFESFLVNGTIPICVFDNIDPDPADRDRRHLQAGVCVH